MPGFFEFREKVTPPRKQGQTARKVVEQVYTESTPQAERSASAWSVHQLTQQIDKAIKGGLPPEVLVRGELSNVSAHAASGHLYFTLKDERAALGGLMWKDKARALRFKPADGLEVLVRGTIGVYPPSGRYQIYAESIEPLGQGALELAFRQLKSTLQAEGLLDPARRKLLPKYPRTLAIVTSPQAAAFADVRKVLVSFPFLRVLVFPVAVQGANAAPQIAAALGSLSRDSANIGSVDAILLVRGGGSLEDLWAFNEEVVARAIAASGIPIISGVGHETDITIADLVADLRAHTPTEAAQVVTRHWRSLTESLANLTARHHRAMTRHLSEYRYRLNLVERSDAIRRPMSRVDVLRQRLDEQHRRMDFASHARVSRVAARLSTLTTRLGRATPAAQIKQRVQRLWQIESALQRAAVLRQRRSDHRLQGLAARFTLVSPQSRLATSRHRLDLLQSRLKSITVRRVSAADASLGRLEAQLSALSPQRVLERGYTLTTIQKSGRVLRTAKDVKPGDRLVTRTAEGEVVSEVEDPQQRKLF